MAYIVTEFPQNAVAKGFSLYMLISSTSVISDSELMSELTELMPINTEVATYTHATNKVQEQAAAKMGNLLKQAL